MKVMLHMAVAPQFAVCSSANVVSMCRQGHNCCASSVAQSSRTAQAYGDVPPVRGLCFLVIEMRWYCKAVRHASLKAQPCRFACCYVTRKVYHREVRKDHEL